MVMKSFDFNKMYKTIMKYENEAVKKMMRYDRHDEVLEVVKLFHSLFDMTCDLLLMGIIEQKDIHVYFGNLYYITIRELYKFRNFIKPWYNGEYKRVLGKDELISDVHSLKYVAKFSNYSRVTELYNEMGNAYEVLYDLFRQKENNKIDTAVYNVILNRFMYELIDISVKHSSLLEQ